MPDIRLPVSQPDIEAFCQKWKVQELALFGSVLTEEFRPDSDVDVLVRFEEGAQPPGAPVQARLEQRRRMRQELSRLFGGRKIDLVTREALINPFIRHHVLTHKQVIYAAR